MDVSGVGEKEITATGGLIAAIIGACSWITYKLFGKKSHRTSDEHVEVLKAIREESESRRDRLDKFISSQQELHNAVTTLVTSQRLQQEWSAELHRAQMVELSRIITNQDRLISATLELPEKIRNSL